MKSWCTNCEGCCHPVCWNCSKRHWLCVVFLALTQLRYCILLQLPSWFTDEKSVYHSRLCLTILTCIVEVRPSCGILSAWVPSLTELQLFCYFHQPPVLRSGAETNTLCTTGSLLDINWHVPWKPSIVIMVTFPSCRTSLPMRSFTILTWPFPWPCTEL